MDVNQFTLYTPFAFKRSRLRLNVQEVHFIVIYLKGNNASLLNESDGKSSWENCICESCYALTRHCLSGREKVCREQSDQRGTYVAINWVNKRENTVAGVWCWSRCV